MAYRSPAREPVDTEDDPYDRELAGRARRWARAFAAARVLVAAAVVALGAVAGLRVWRAKALERRLRAEVAQEERPRRLSGLDALYGEALPAWVISLNVLHQVAAGEAYERSTRLMEARFRAMRAREGDPALQSYIDRIHALMLDDIADKNWEVYDLFSRWNGDIAARGHPYRIEHSIGGDPLSPTLYVTVYRALTMGTVRVGAAEVPARVLGRIDRANLTVADFGAAGPPELAVARVDRARDHVVRELWPLLDATADPSRSPAERRWLLHLRGELRAAASPTLYAAAATGAQTYRALGEVVAGVNARARCGSTFRLFGARAHGLTARDKLAVLRAAEARSNPLCPAVTADEAASMIALSDALARTAHLDDALDAFTAAVLRATLVGEARGIVDARAAGLHGAVPCPGCDASTDAAARAELSVRLARFTTPGAAYLARHHACVTAEGEGPRAEAMRVASREVFPEGCDAAPPDELAARARAAEARLFRRDEAVEVPDALVGEGLLRAMAAWR